MILIMCPTSRSGKGKRNWKYWKNHLQNASIAHTCVKTTHAGHACEIASQADETVVAVGGDGTINEVLNGCITNPSQPQMGVLYSGTSPDFCRFHKIPVAPDDSIKTLINAKSSKVDVVKLQYYTKNNSPKCKYFACSCNIGLGSDVARFANRSRGRLGDTLGTFIGLTKAIAQHKSRDLKLNIDGQSHIFPNCNHFMIIKNPYIASGMKLHLDIRGNDSKAFIMAICSRSRLGLMKLLPKIYNGSITSAKNIFLEQFTQIEISSPESTEIEFDGDPQGFLPVKAEIVPKKLDLIGASNA